jgi:F-box-like
VRADRKCQGWNKVDVSDNRQVTSHQRTITELGGTDHVYPRVTFGALPDDVLLEIFNFYLACVPFEHYRFRCQPEDAWHMLVHVCKRWRSIVFASPHRLKLQLLCKNNRPVQTLDIWPELPIVISGSRGMSERDNTNNIIAPLTQHHRVVKIDMVEIPNSFLTRMRVVEMRGPFSALKSLRLISTRIDAPALPDSFLGGSAPRLQKLLLIGVPFPALPNLLLSAHDLVQLHLLNIPLSGYITPDAMVSGLSALTRLQVLRLEFRSPRSRADRETRLVPRLTRLVLPAINELYFKGHSEYLEDLVAQIDTPLLTRFKITFFNQLIFDTPLLRHFISYTETFKAPHQARVAFRQYEVNVGLYLRIGNSLHERLSLTISCRPSDWQLSSLAQVCDSALSPIPMESLVILITGNWKDDVEIAQWPGLLHSFTSIQDLLIEEMSISHGFLKQLAREIEAFSALRNLYLECPQPPEPAMKMIGKFVAARQLSGRPVAVYHREWLRRTWQQMHWEVGD